MGKIVILDENTSNQIAAGEVIERPASIVKEMVENSIDAGATSITVEITGGGIRSIRVTDNGDGIGADDVAMAFERHATSKIKNIYDLDKLSTMGFRGEALASIASVAKVEVITRTEEAQTGTRVIVEAGDVLLVEPAGAPKGTTFIVRELFYNTPARYKFLKKDTTEAGYIHDILNRIALARPDISIKLINQGKTVIHTPGNHDLLSVIYSLYGKEIARSVIPVEADDDGLGLTGFIGKPEIARGNRSYQSVIVNGRCVYNRIITAALEEAYKTKLMQKRFPFAVLKLSISPHLVDVNVHPAKLEVRFADENKVYRVVYHSVMAALTSQSLIPDAVSMLKSPVKPEKPPETEQTGFSTANAVGSLSHVKPEDSAHLSFNSVNAVRKPGSTVDKNADSSVKAILNQYSIKKPVESLIAHPVKSEEPIVADEGKLKVETDKALYKNNNIETKKDTTSDDDRIRLVNAEIVGQAFNSFIFLEEGEELFLIDQHAAHERIQYEKIRKRFAAGDSVGQMLLSPLTADLTEIEMDKFQEIHKFIERLGFEAEVFGSRSVIIRSIPYDLDGSFTGQDFLDILNKLSGEIKDVSEIIPEETIYMMACKCAIKAKKAMSGIEIRGLIDELVKTENPYTCVHGRPVIISIGKRELEKRFKRIL